MPKPRLSYAGLKAVPQLKGIRFSLESGVDSESPLHVPRNGFSLSFGQILISVRPCAELTNQLCRHKVRDKSSLAFHFVYSQYIPGLNHGLLSKVWSANRLAKRPKVPPL